MAKEVLCVPEDVLEEVIRVIRAGLRVSIPTPRVYELLHNWCAEEEEYLRMKCLGCNQSTDYPNGLCGPCYNVGIRGRLPDGPAGVRGNIVVDRAKFIFLLKELVESSRGDAFGWVATALEKDEK